MLYHPSTKMETKQPSDYEIKALAEIHRWKDPSIGFFGRAASVVNWPLDKAAGMVSKVPGVEWAVERSIGGMVGLLNDAAQWSVRPRTILAEYRAADCDLREQGDIFSLDLADVDRVIGRLDLKYEGLAAAEGAATGLVGVLGVPADVVALAGLMLRAIGEYATYCGFDAWIEEERIFAMQILNLASSPNERAKRAALAQLVRIGRDVAARRMARGARTGVLSQVIEQMAKTVGGRLSRDKMDHQRGLREAGLPRGAVPLPRALPGREVRRGPDRSDRSSRR